MARIKRPEDGNSSGYSQLVLGMLAGALLMFLYLGPTEETSQLPQTTALRSATPPKDSEGDGWHPINVFYGEKSGLKADPNAKWFAQVHQDEILVDLIGDNGYFIDLAANDAVELTNTLALGNSPTAAAVKANRSTPSVLGVL